MNNRLPSDACRSARVERVIVTEAVFGGGVISDPLRLVTQYWSLEGALLATVDPTGDFHTAVAAMDEANRDE